MKRSRGRGRRQQNPVNRSYDSNGPDVRVRGTASQVFEKYQALARDAMSAGDRVMAENYQQHAEHYFRIVQSFQQQANEAGDAAGDNTNGASDEAGMQSDGNGAANGASNRAENGSENGPENGSEPLVLVRENEAEDGSKEAGKSRRRGPLGKKRKAKPVDGTDGDEGVAVAEASAESAETGEGEAAISGE